MKSLEVQRLLEIVGYALELSGDERDAYLDRTCGQDENLRHEVLNYLQYEDMGSLIAQDSSMTTALELPNSMVHENRYELGEEIARGGMGVILRAYDRNLRREVAVKVLRDGNQKSPDVVRRFLQEAQIGGQLQHPGIAPVYEIGRLPDNRPFIAMKLVKGETLATMLAKRGDVDDDQAKMLEIFDRVCQAIAFAQTRGVIHRDLKPANVMVGEFGEVQVMDWGLAKIISEDQLECPPGRSLEVFDEPESAFPKVDTDSDAYRTRIGRFMGTPAYMPPEQPLGRSDKKTDVFSLGAILCEILTGKPTGKPTGNNLEAANDRLDQSQSDKSLIQLARDCIQRSPADRPKDVRVVAMRISAHLNAVQSRLREAEIATARAEGKAEEERKRRLRTLRTVAVVATILVVASLVGWLIRNEVIAMRNRDNATAMVSQLLTADIAQVPSIVKQMEPYHRWTVPLLEAELAISADGSFKKMYLALALLPMDDGQVDYLSRQLPVCTPRQFSVVRDALLPHESRIRNRLWEIVQDQHADTARRFQVAAALSKYDFDDKRWNEIAPFVAQHLTSDVSIAYVENWLQFFQPCNKYLLKSLIALHADRSRSRKQLETAAFVLADYLQHKPDNLIEVILAADDWSEFKFLVEALRPHSEAVKQSLIDEMNAAMPVKSPIGQRDARWIRQSMAAVTLVHLGHGDEAWPLLKLTHDPSLRSFIIYHLGKLQANHMTLAARLKVEDDVSIRRALIQSLGGLDAEQFSTRDRNRIAEQLRSLYFKESDPGIHSSASWALRRWGVTISDSQVGEPDLTEEPTQRSALLKAEIEKSKQRLSVYKQELFAARQAEWERELTEQQTDSRDDLSDGLVAHYPLDETDGNKTANGVTGQPDGIFQGPGQPEWVPGIVGGALQLDGKGGCINCGTAFVPERMSSFSVGCWFFAEPSPSGSQKYGDGRGSLFGTTGFSVQVVPNWRHVRCEWIHQFPLNHLAVSATDDQIVRHWHHLFVTYDGSSSSAGVTIFLDGQKELAGVLSDSLSKDLISSPLLLGKRDHSLSFNGKIDDVRIYDRQLSKTQVLRLYEYGLRTLAGIPAQRRTTYMQEFLTEQFLGQDQLLKQLEDQLAAAESAARENDGYGWHVNSQGQTMLVIPKYKEIGNDHLDYTFAISSHEVTVAEFRQFQKNPEFSWTISPAYDCPINGVSWYQATEYCNWLSHKDGIPEDQWIYLPNENGKFADGMRIKARFLELNGYRLPTEAEWEQACLVGATGMYGFGEPVVLLREYAQYFENSSGQTRPVESFLPNEFGLFDMLGNVSEWTQTQATGEFSPVASNSPQKVVGGAFGTPSGHFQASHYKFSKPGSRSFNTGFRPVRTYHGSRSGKIETQFKGK